MKKPYNKSKEVRIKKVCENIINIEGTIKTTSNPKKLTSLMSDWSDNVHELHDVMRRPREW